MAENENKEKTQQPIETEESDFFSDWPMMNERLKYMPKEKGLSRRLLEFGILILLTYCAYKFHLYFALPAMAGVAVSLVIIVYSLIKTRGVKATIWPFILSVYLVIISIVSVPVKEVVLEDGTVVMQVDIDEKFLEFLSFGK